MRDFDQNYLELAVGYVNEGMLEEAEDVLLRYRGRESNCSLIILGYIQDQKGNSDQAKKYFSKGSMSFRRLLFSLSS